MDQQEEEDEDDAKAPIVQSLFLPIARQSAAAAPLPATPVTPPPAPPPTSFLLPPSSSLLLPRELPPESFCGSSNSSVTVPATRCPADPAATLAEPLQPQPSTASHEEAARGCSKTWDNLPPMRPRGRLAPLSSHETPPPPAIAGGPLPQEHPFHFHSLLRCLGEAHERELQQLRSQIGLGLCPPLAPPISNHVPPEPLAAPISLTVENPTHGLRKRSKQSTGVPAGPAPSPGQVVRRSSKPHPNAVAFPLRCLANGENGDHALEHLDAPSPRCLAAAGDGKSDDGDGAAGPKVASSSKDAHETDMESGGDELLPGSTAMGFSSSKESVRRSVVREPRGAAKKNFEVSANWKCDPRISPAAKLRFIARKSSKVPLGQTSEAFNDGIVIRSNSRWQKYVLHPSSNKRVFWDLTSMTLLAYDMIMIPFLAAFDVDMTSGLVMMTWNTMLFWTLDVPITMMTGYQTGKHTVIAPSRVISRYLRTWFVMDVVIVSTDWVTTMASSIDGEAGQTSAARLGRSLRTLRFLRTLRLIRVLKLKRLIQVIQDLINTETVSIGFGVVKIVINLVIANHLVACCWYSIGRAGNDRPNWIHANGLEGRGIGYRYLTSLHWSLTQFTPASMEVVPQNAMERSFAVLVLLFAMITFSSFVSILTASITQLRRISSDGSRQFWLLRRYLRDWHVSRATSLRIQRYLEYAYRRQHQRVQEHSVELLALLSEPLREELKCETFRSHLRTHAFFDLFGERTRLFGKALSSTSLARGDEVFSCGEEGFHMRFVSSGLLEYSLGFLDPDDDQDLSRAITATSFFYEDKYEEDGRRQSVLEGQWVCEAALWTEWFHLGDLSSAQESQIISVEAKTFSVAVSTNPRLLRAAKEYAETFVRRLNNFDSESLTDLFTEDLAPGDILGETGISIFAVEEQIEQAEQQEESTVGFLRRSFTRMGSELIDM